MCIFGLNLLFILSRIIVVVYVWAKSQNRAKKEINQSQEISSNGQPLPHPTSSRMIPCHRQPLRGEKSFESYPNASSSFNHPFASESRGGSAAPLCGNNNGAHGSFLPGLLNSPTLNNKIHQHSLQKKSSSTTPKKSVDNFFLDPSVSSTLPGTVSRSPVQGTMMASSPQRPISRSPNNKLLSDNEQKGMLTPHRPISRSPLNNRRSKNEGPWSDGPRGRRPDTTNRRNSGGQQNSFSSHSSIEGDDKPSNKQGGRGLPVSERMALLFGDINEDKTPRPPTATTTALVDRYNLAPKLRPGSRRANRGTGGHVSPEHVGDIVFTCMPFDKR